MWADTSSVSQHNYRCLRRRYFCVCVCVVSLWLACLLFVCSSSYADHQQVMRWTVFVCLYVCVYFSLIQVVAAVTAGVTTECQRRRTKATCMLPAQRCFNAACFTRAWNRSNGFASISWYAMQNVRWCGRKCSHIFQWWQFSRYAIGSQFIGNMKLGRSLFIFDTYADHFMRTRHCEKLHFNILYDRDGHISSFSYNRRMRCYFMLALLLLLPHSKILPHDWSVL